MRFQVRIYYGKGAKLPSVPGMLALHTWNIGTLSKDMEVDAARRRPEIGRIEVAEDGPGGVWEEVYNEAVTQQ